MLHFLSLLAILQSGAPPQLPPPEPMVIVDDAAAIRRAVGGRIEAVFTPTRDEAETPRKDLARYLQTERKREKTHNAGRSFIGSRPPSIATSGTAADTR